MKRKLFVTGFISVSGGLKNIFPLAFFPFDCLAEAAKSIPWLIERNKQPFKLMMPHEDRQAAFPDFPLCFFSSFACVAACAKASLSFLQHLAMEKKEEEGGRRRTKEEKKSGVSFIISPWQKQLLLLWLLSTYNEGIIPYTWSSSLWGCGK